MTQVEGALLLQKGFMMGITVEFWRNKCCCWFHFSFLWCFSFKSSKHFKDISKCHWTHLGEVLSYPTLRGQTVPRTALFCRTGWYSSFRLRKFFTDEMYFGWLAWKSHSKGAAQLNRQSLQILGPWSLMWVAWPGEQENTTAHVHPVSRVLGSRSYSWVLSHPWL